MNKMILSSLLSCQLLLMTPATVAASVTVFESAHVRPLAVDTHTQRLFAVNTPDNRLTIYEPTASGLTLLAEVPVGLEPVSVAIRKNSNGVTEAWVVNHLSDSISIVEIADEPSLSNVRQTLLVGDEPRDIVFAGPNHDRAFITTAHRGQNRPGDPQLTTQGVGRADVWVFDTNNPGTSMGGNPLNIIELFGDTPRALATSPDGKMVYAAVFASGNQTTAIPAPAVFSNGGLPPAPEGSTAGAPSTGLIVKYDGTAWVDESGKDWSRYVPFALPDRDVFLIDASANPPVSLDTPPPSSALGIPGVDTVLGGLGALAGAPSPTPGDGSFSGVGTMLFNMAVRPDNGALYVTNTEAFNEVRFEPMMTGKFAQNRITIIKGDKVLPIHLNPHIDYSVPTGTQAEIDQSLASPMDLVFSADGSKVFVAGFSSNAVAVLGTDALEAGQIDKRMIRVGQGPSGLALDPERDRLYVMNRLDHSISIIDGATSPSRRAETARVALPFDPTPQSVKDGRQFLYDASISSGHGDLSCHTCHVFSDVDHLAWDLGDPFGAVTENPNDKANVNGSQAGGLGGNAIPSEFHPMKGPMTTQALRGMANAGPMHWRGDKTGGLTLDGAVDPEGDFLDEHAAFLRFNGAFVGLQGRSEQLKPEEMDAYADFMLQVRYPPNPIKALSNSDSALEASGREIFLEDPTSFAGAFSCNDCHALPVTTTGLAASAGFETSRLFKIPHLRNMYQKVGKFGVPVGMTLSPMGQITLATPNYLGDQVRGFGFAHDGSIDTIDTFLHNFTFLPFPVPNNPVPDSTAPAIRPDRRAALVAFILAMDTGLAPVVGQQLTVTTSNVDKTDIQKRLQLFLERADAGDAELVIKGVWDGASRGALYVGDGMYQTDRASESLLQHAELLAFANHSALTFTAVPPTSGRRIAIDRDLDGTLDGDEGGQPASVMGSSASKSRGGSLGYGLLLLCALGMRRRRVARTPS